MQTTTNTTVQQKYSGNLILTNIWLNPNVLLNQVFHSVILFPLLTCEVIIINFSNWSNGKISAITEYIHC